MSSLFLGGVTEQRRFATIVLIYCNQITNQKAIDESIS